MKRSIITPIIALPILFAATTINAGAWKTSQLTANGFDDILPQVNNNGSVVWQGQGSKDTEDTAHDDWEIFYYFYNSLSENGTIYQVTRNSYHDEAPQINARDEFIWEGYINSVNEIFHWKEDITKQITTNTYYNAEPQINDSGYIAWSGIPDDDVSSTDSKEVYVLYGDSHQFSFERKELIGDETSNDYIQDSGISIDDTTIVSWRRDDLADSKIITSNLVDGGFFLERSSPYIQNNKMNVQGHIVWQGRESNEADYEIFYWDGESDDVIQLTDNDYDDVNPEISDNGIVTWVGKGNLDGNDTKDREIFYWDGSTVKQLTHNNYHDEEPRINNYGDIIWEGEGNLDGEDPSDDLEIFLYKDNEVTQITNNSCDDEHADLSDESHLVWAGNVKVGNDCGTREIFLATWDDTPNQDICATLGDNDSWVMDWDFFTFDGEEGDEVTVTLKTDESGSHTGDRATLILRDKIYTTYLFKMNRGALSNRVSATLPASGKYKVLVKEQSKYARGKKFKGDYCLELDSSNGANLVPTSTVE